MLTFAPSFGGGGVLVSKIGSLLVCVMWGFVSPVTSLFYGVFYILLSLALVRSRTKVCGRTLFGTDLLC